MGDEKEVWRIYNKPLSVCEELKSVADHMADVLPDSNLLKNYKLLISSGFLEKDLDIWVEQNGLECHMVFPLFHHFVNGMSGFCVDGIRIKRPDGYTSILKRFVSESGCVLNFIGEHRPQLSVSRESLIDTDLEDYDDRAKDLIEEVILKSLSKMCEYLSSENVSKEND